jgi:hypothetical protein
LGTRAPTFLHMADAPINFSSGLPTTVLPPPDPALAAALAAAVASGTRDRVAEVVGGAPRFMEGWATLGDLGRDPVERYAYYRVGYHRGLDALRANGWRGTGFVRWGEPGNDGFLRCLRGLQQMAAAIGERDEAERCATFLYQLDPRGDAEV